MPDTFQYAKMILDSGGECVSVCTDETGAEFIELTNPLQQRGVLVVDGGMYLRLYKEGRVFYAQSKSNMPEKVRFRPVSGEDYRSIRQQIKRRLDTEGQKARFKVVFPKEQG